ncbi:hypothetical protein ACA910_012112 [Epithemia clementina (nom. ined.)]
MNGAVAFGTVVVLCFSFRRPFFFRSIVSKMSSTLPSPRSSSTATSTTSSSPPPAQPRYVYGKDDALFGSIEKQQGDKPFGVVLDAGTGLHSLRWLATLKSKGLDKCIAVTADPTMQRNCQREVEALQAADHIDVVIGNWFERNEQDINDFSTTNATSSPSLQSLLVGGNESLFFDVILADYLIGAMDGFSPYAQDLMIPKLARLLKPGGRLYIVGLQPIPDQVPSSRGSDEAAIAAANIICKVRQVRDACILLAGHRCYREYPVDWIQRQVLQCGNRSISSADSDNDDDADSNNDTNKNSNLRLVNTIQMPILYRYETILKQINVARSKFPFFPNKALATSMGAVLDDLAAQAKKATQDGQKRIRLGFDYIVCAEKDDTIY